MHYSSNSTRHQISSSVSQPNNCFAGPFQTGDLDWNHERSMNNTVQKPLEESSDDGSSLLLPLSNTCSLNAKGGRRRSMPDASTTVSDPECVTVTVNSDPQLSDTNSDFEVNDLVFGEEKYDSDSNSKLAVGSHTNLFQGSTNNLAEFEDNELATRQRPSTLDITR